MTAIGKEPRSVGRRDWRTIALAEAVGICTFTFGLFALTLIIRNEFTSLPDIGFAELLNKLGARSGDLAMGALGVVATVQLACLIAIVSGQIIHNDGAEESKLRSMLSIISMVSVVIAGPAVLATSTHAARSLEEGGLLLVIPPIYLLQAAISTAIGTFEVGDDNTLLTFAQERMSHLENEALRLQTWPTAPPWRAATSAAIALGTALLLSVPIVIIVLHSFEKPSLEGITTASIALIAGVVIATLGLVMTDCQLKRSVKAVDVISVIVIHLMTVAFFIFSLLVAVTFFWPLAISMAILALIFIVRAVISFLEGRRARKGLPPRTTPFWTLSTFSLVGTREAIVGVEKERASTQKQVNKYSARIAAHNAQQGSSGFEGGLANADLKPSRFAYPRKPRLSRVLGALFN